ncbi:endonuclease V [Methanonatronarchaeum thermophilum]|uniref:endonuclease V n=1 Tax=Methanonatronarchaeum thermophilum TaxID=1927129 RepID=UPI001374777E|nr:endonuclease V [Methanonatronarchaeum thermophilum]
MKIADKARFVDDFDDLSVVGGVDQAFIGRDVVVSVAVVMDYKFNLIGKSVCIDDVSFPYIPGLLAFREAPTAIRALRSLEELPDVVLVDGSGLIHPRGAGMATHIGVKLDLPTVGVTKSLLCGEVVEEPEVVGDRSPVLLDDRVVGYCFLSKKRCNPLYISPGHRVSPETAVDLVNSCLDGYKMPEPIRCADKLADMEKKRFS